MRIYVLGIVLLAGCGPEKTERCYFGNRMVVLEQAYDAEHPPYSCEHFVKALDIIDQTAREISTDPRFYFFKSHVENLTIEVKPTVAWYRPSMKPDKDGFYRESISGESLCGVRHIYINSYSNLLKSSIAHELAHIAQDCEGTPGPGSTDPNDYNDVHHRNWHRDGIFAMIDRVHSRSWELDL